MADRRFFDKDVYHPGPGKKARTPRSDGTWLCGCLEEDGSSVVRQSNEPKCWTCLNVRAGGAA
jgi:hypothetical protein